MHKLLSQEKNDVIAEFIIFDVDKIKCAAKAHLKSNKSDTLELLKNDEIISFFEVNKRSGRPSRCVLIGNKTFYKSL